MKTQMHVFSRDTMFEGGFQGRPGSCVLEGYFLRVGFKGHPVFFWGDTMVEG